MTEKTFLTATIYVGRGSAIHDTCAKRLPRKARPYWNHKHGHACIVALCTNQLANELAHSFPFLCKNVFGHKCLFLKSISINFSPFLRVNSILPKTLVLNVKTNLLSRWKLFTNRKFRLLNITFAVLSINDDLNVRWNNCSLFFRSP